MIKRLAEKAFFGLMQFDTSEVKAGVQSGIDTWHAMPATRRMALTSIAGGAASLAGVHFLKTSGLMGGAEPVHRSDRPVAIPSHAADRIDTANRDVTVAPASVLPVRNQTASCFVRADGAVLLGADYNIPLIPASQTKSVFAPGLFEALLAGRIQPDTTLTVKERHIAQHEVNGPKIRLAVGDTMTVSQAAMLAFNLSHNSAATMMAEAGFGGDLQAALDYANNWTKECWRVAGYEGVDFHGRFLTAHGLTRRESNRAGARDLPLDQQNRTTALELVTFARVISANYDEQVQRYMGIPMFRFDGQEINNSNRLLQGNPRRVDAGAEPVPGVVGGKTGLTDLSGASLQFHYQSPGTGAEFFGIYAGANGGGRVVRAAQQARRVLLDGLRADVNRTPPQLVSVDSLDRDRHTPRVAGFVPSV